MYSVAGKRLAAFLLVCLSSFVFSQTAFAGGDEWRAVSPAELAMKTAKVDADADAEAIFWEVRVDDTSQDLVMKHYIRVKIFTERGRDKYSKIDIPFLKGVKIKDISARVVKTDGSSVELTKSDVFEREIVKTDKIKVKAKSFAVPNIEPGVIVEYRYQETYPHSTANNMRMTFQHEIPIENITYYFKPLDNARYLTFNMSGSKFVKDKNGFYKAAMENVPAIKAEAQMPPEDEVRSWLVLYYTDDTKGDSNKFWANAGYYIAHSWEIKDTLKPGKELKAAAAEITAGASTPDEQLAKIYAFCKTKIKNISFDAQLTDEQKEDIKPNKSTADTYRKLQGTSVDINELFASLATAAGLEARLAFGGDRSEKFFDPQQAHVSFIHFSSIAVKVGAGWKYYDPGSLFVPYGMLAWNEEATSVLLLGYKDYVTTKTPLSGAEKSASKRTARFKLSEDGTLEGTVRVEYTGQESYLHKLDAYKDSATKREEDLKNEIKKRISAAEISDIQIESAQDAEKSFAYQYKIRVPNYAQRTGKRLFFQPGFFKFGESPMFSSAARKYDVYFHYPWAENDDVQIQLPANFSLDNADSPGIIADPQRISALDIDITVNQTTRTLLYKRKFHFGGGDTILFPAGAYQPLKNLFDAFSKADAHTITLKQN